MTSLGAADCGMIRDHLFYNSFYNPVLGFAHSSENIYAYTGQS